MKVFALSTFVLPGGKTSEQGEVYDLPDTIAAEAIGIGLAALFVEAPPAEPKPTKTKKGSADVQP